MTKEERTIYDFWRNETLLRAHASLEIANACAQAALNMRMVPKLYEQWRTQAETASKICEEHVVWAGPSLPPEAP